MKTLHILLIYILYTSPLFAQKMTASDGAFDDKAAISWDVIPGAEFYRLERVYNAPYDSKMGKIVDLETNILIPSTKNTSYIDESIPAGQYLYTVTGFKTNISEIEETPRQKRQREDQIKKDGTNIAAPMQTNIISVGEIKDLGHRKITDTEFFLEFQKGIDSSLPRIRTMKMLNFFGEKKPGWVGGSLIYKTSGIFRKPFRVTIDYKDFTDQYLKLNGVYEVQIYKLLAQEGKLIGTVTHNLIVDGGQSVGGTYEVQQEGKPMVSLPWNVTTHPLDDSQYDGNLKSSLKASEEK